MNHEVEQEESGDEAPLPRRGVDAATGMAAALSHDPRVAMWLADGLAVETARILVRLQSLAGLRRMAVMPDVHPSRSVCVGCVLGTEGVVYPEAIGGDIGCGMSAVRVQGVVADDVVSEAGRRVLTALDKRVDVMVRTPRSLEPADAGPGADALRDARLRKAAVRLGEPQLGTLGRGNHFVEVQRDEDGSVWIMVHSGSRAMGQAVALHYGNIARTQGVRSVLPGLTLASGAGQDYLADQEWCVRYAAANRRGLLGAAAAGVVAVCGGRAEWGTLLDAPHNFLRVEDHDSGRLAVHRKGAAPASVGRCGLIPGSAGTLSVHVEGRGEPRSLHSSSHGAGRVLSRGDARRSITLPMLRRQMGAVVYDTRREQGLRDESPGAYRDLREVLAAQRDLVKVTRTLRPLVSFKAGG